MAAGLPSVATDVGGNAEAVRDGIDGLIVVARDVSAIGDALVKLANDSGLRATMGRAARQRAASEFAFEPCARAYERFYQAVLDGKPIATAFDGSESASSPQKMPSQSVS
jgi:glycosyltransferase involved in cell wall biosynthesis